MKCAAFELPFAAEEGFGREPVQAILQLLSEEGFVHLVEDGSSPGQWNWTNESYPADAVSLRSISSDNFVVVDTTRGADIIGETDYTSALSTLHEKAIYLVEGRLFQVEKLDIEGRKAYVRQVDCDYYTDAITYSRVTILDVFQTDSAAVSSGPYVGPSFSSGNTDDEDALRRLRLIGRLKLGHVLPALRSHGDVRVVSRVVGFKKIKFYTNENVGSGELDLPEQQMHTTAYWLTLPRALMASLAVQPRGSARRRGRAGVRDGAGGAAAADVRPPRSRALDWVRRRRERPARRSRPQDLEEPRIFVYDNYPGGIGFSEPLFGMHDALVAETRKLIAGCECDHGCPTCVGPVGETGPEAKPVALLILDRLLGLRPA